MEILFLIGRILFGGFFVMSGMNHFMKMGMMAQYAGMKGVPSPKLAVIVSGLLIVKNIALLGAALMTLAIPTPWAFSVF